ncbi:MAG: M3 family oligoendopeptidase [Clostridiales bacterium]|nr:M3 family oligoendopeptidase [Clostridiales bacterium]
MDIRWKLDNIYKSLDCEELSADISEYSEKLDALNTFAEVNFNDIADPERVIEGYISKVNELLLYNKISAYLNFILSADTENKQAAKLFDRVSSISAKAAKSESLFKEYIKNINVEKFINNPVIKEHICFLKREKEDAAHTLSPEAEETAASLKATGSQSWQKLWEGASSSLMCSFRGKEVSLSEIRGMAYSSDKTVRRDAYEGELAAYEKISSVGAACLNAIKGEVISLCNLRGYKSPLEESALTSGIDLDILKAMTDAIDENIYALNKFYRIKAEYMGKKRLPFYDLFAPVGESELKFTFEEAKSYVVNTYSGFSEKLGAFAKKAFKGEWVDAFPRKGKVGGAYCEYIKSIEESRVLMNFSGNFEDIITLSHELGHGYHNEVLRNESPVNSDYPMTLAETASTFCENLSYKRAETVFSGQNLLTVKESRLSGELQSICDIYSRFLFEDSFFEERKKGGLSAEEICSLMEKAQKKAYFEGLDPEYLHPYMWLCKPHYYDADFNYYNYPYAFGDLFARSLFAMYEEKGAEFVPQYDIILSNAGKKTVKEVGKLAGIDFTDKTFWEKGIKNILKDIDSLEELMKK